MLARVSEVRAAAIVLGAGAGRRVGAEEPKAFLTIGGRPILAVAAAAAVASPAIVALVVTAPAGYEDRAWGCVEGLGVPCAVVLGGTTRQASVRAALEQVPDDTEVVTIHDAARPFAPPDLFTAAVAAVTAGAAGAVPVVPVTDTVKRVRSDAVIGTLDRDELALAQTPQAFRLDVLRAAHERAEREGVRATDDAMLLEGDGRVAAIPGDPMNVKITTLLDLAFADARMGGGGLA
jgi:2-C-methyl-D-erythritol 4-phosphate cytidylyltransferase/2-C-methyl-D-erythritol 2,4-cyclodiphosphate synthase